MKALSRSLSVLFGAKHNLGHSVTLVMVLICGLSMSAKAEWVGDARPLMGTEVSVLLWHDDVALGNELVERVFEEVERINQLMSTYIDDSRITAINRKAADEPVVAGDELFNLIQRSLDVSVLTLGAFDITYDSVGQHYDFRNRRRPDSATVEAERKLIEYRFVELDQAAGTVHFREPGVRINLGGIAKGYVVERGVDLLRLSGVQNAIVTAGGDVNFNGPFIWNRGTLEGSGTTFVNGGMSVLTDSSHTISRRLEVASAASWDGGPLTVSSSGVLGVAAGGTFEVTDGLTLAGAGSVDNGGRILKAGGDGAATIQPSFTNTGTIEVARAVGDVRARVNESHQCRRRD